MGLLFRLVGSAISALEDFPLALLSWARVTETLVPSSSLSLRRVVGLSAAGSWISSMSLTNVTLTCPVVAVSSQLPLWQHSHASSRPAFERSGGCDRDVAEASALETPEQPSDMQAAKRSSVQFSTER